jgi:hypothetical protein
LLAWAKAGAMAQKGARKSCGKTDRGERDSLLPKSIRYCLINQTDIYPNINLMNQMNIESFSERVRACSGAARGAQFSMFYA